MELDGLFAYYSKLSSIHYLVTLSYKRLNAQASISTRLLILQILEVLHSASWNGDILWPLSGYD